MARPVPEWFKISEEVTPQVMQRIAASVFDLPFSLQVRYAPMLAHWFVLETLLLSNRANREGMHANALSVTRQCVEAISIIELGVCGHPEAEAVLLKWKDDRLNPGKLRAWLESNVWQRYGAGVWTKPWPVFMREFVAAVQPYAHYGRNLAQWQLRLHRYYAASEDSSRAGHALLEMKPRAYDPQKATRITLFHTILTFTLGRIWAAANQYDREFKALIDRLRLALGRSRYLDGHQTDWSQQFWAAVWASHGGTILE